MAYPNTAAYGVFNLPVKMRTNPTIETSGTASHYRLYQGNTAITCNAVPVIDQAHPETPTLGFSVASGLINGSAVNVVSANTTAAFIGFRAEL
jgi:hypothetical protein